MLVLRNRDREFAGKTNLSPRKARIMVNSYDFLIKKRISVSRSMLTVPRNCFRPAFRQTLPDNDSGQQASVMHGKNCVD